MPCGATCIGEPGSRGCPARHLRGNLARQRRSARAAGHAEDSAGRAVGRGVRLARLAWEIGLLGNPWGGRPSLRLLPDPRSWFARVMAGLGIRQATLASEIAINVSYLPSDLADRLLIATACHFGITIVTQDTKIIAYATQCFVQAIAC